MAANGMYTHGSIVIFLGPPGSGKGTQAARLSSQLQIPAISTGEILRQACQSGSDIGKLVRCLMEAGKLVSDELMNEVVSQRLLEQDCRDGCILDGYPRTVTQARFLSDWLAGHCLPTPLVVDFHLPVSDVIRRLSQRRYCGQCGRIYGSNSEANAPHTRCESDGSLLLRRSDDRPEVIRARLKLHNQNARDLVRFFRNDNYVRLEASGSPDQVFRDLVCGIGLYQSAPEAHSLRHSSARSAFGL
jgi:adenylate kinase